MPSKYWIKLNHSLLNNGVVMRLPDPLFCRLIKMFLVFGIYGKEQPGDWVIADLLQISVEDLRADLAVLQANGLIERVDGFWWSDLYESMQGNRPRWLSLPWMRVRDKVLDRDQDTCRYCGKLATHVDHIYPKSRGGKDDMDNLVAACADCNMGKGARTPQEAGMELLPGLEL